MANPRMEVVAFRKTKNDKTYAVKLGSAVVKDDGSMTLYLDAMPCPENGQFVLSVTHPREQRQASPAPRQSGFDSDMDVPF